MTQTNAEKQAKYRLKVAEKFASQDKQLIAQSEEITRLSNETARLNARVAALTSRLDALESEMRMVRQGVGLALMAAMTMRFS